MGSASISPDGRFLFFGRDDSDTTTGLDVYCVDAALQDELR